MSRARTCSAGGQKSPGQLKVGLDKVRVVSPFVGGAFGSKGPMRPRTALIAFAARKLGRPVRCVVERKKAYSI
jgi:xanthine dehydrogenase YagR molybdenum-binding subunit